MGLSWPGSVAQVPALPTQTPVGLDGHLRASVLFTQGEPSPPGYLFPFLHILLGIFSMTKEAGEEEQE